MLAVGVSRRFRTIVVALLLTIYGCGERGRNKYSTTESRLSKLGLSYGLYVGRHDGRLPSDIEALRNHVKQSIKPEQLEALGVVAADELFISGRDGKPFVMVTYNRVPPPSESGQPPVVLYEQVGDKGQRFIAFLGGGVEEVDDERFRELVRPEP